MVETFHPSFYPDVETERDWWIFPLQGEDWNAFFSSERARLGAKARPSMCLPGTVRRRLGTELCGGGGGYVYSLSWRRHFDTKKNLCRLPPEEFALLQRGG